MARLGAVQRLRRELRDRGEGTGGLELLELLGRGALDLLADEKHVALRSACYLFFCPGLVVAGCYAVRVNGPRKPEPAWLVRVLKGEAQASPKPDPKVQLRPVEPLLPKELQEQTDARKEAEQDRYRKLARERAEKEEREERERSAARIDLQKIYDEIASELPRPILFYPEHRPTERKIRDFEARILEDPSPRQVVELANLYGRCGFAVFDLKSVMNDHPEEMARRWPLACGHPLDAWIKCPRGDWLLWPCVKSRGWGYPGAWRAAIDCVQAAVDVGVGDQILEEIRVKAIEWLKTLRHCEKMLFLGQARVLAKDLHEVYEAACDELDRIDRDLDVEDLPTFLAQHVAEACADLATPCESEDHEPHLEALVHSAVVLGRLLPQFAQPPAGWKPDLDPEKRASAWEDGERWEFETKAKLELFADTVRRRIPVPIDPSA